MIFKYRFIGILALSLWVQGVGGMEPVPSSWVAEWPRTDFSQTAVAFDEIISGGPPKDGIPAIDEPTFSSVSEVNELGADEPVLMVEHGGRVKAYPLRVMLWHEIVNDHIAERPITVTYCPLCNSAIVFDRRVDGRVLEFGVSGKLRHSDMVMYDRQTESWWQQFVGQAIVGEMTGVQLTMLPSRVVPFSLLKAEYPDAQVLEAPRTTRRNYGANPYVNYDSSAEPFLYRGDYDGPGEALSYVIAVGKRAYLLDDIRRVGLLEQDGLRIRWQEGMNSALDTSSIRTGRDIGFVRVQQKRGDGYEDLVFDMTFAFAFKAFHPDGEVISVP